MKMTLGWTIVYVDDPAAAAQFYEQTFGLEPEFVAGHDYAQMRTGTTKLGFASYELGRANFPGGVQQADGRPFNVELALVHEDVDGAYRIALDAGCTSLAEPKDKPQGQRVAWVRDPFGTLLELATPL
jgi:uncharacterized glyoxalase superfamily protein PhnB